MEHDVQPHEYRASFLAKLLTRILWIDDPEAYERRRVGSDWPADAETMVGLARLKNVLNLIFFINGERPRIDGDFMECGVWRGGCAIMMAAAQRETKLSFKRYVPDRTIWVADSFQGCPPPSLPQDAGDVHHTMRFLSVSRAEVEANFKRYGLLRDNVKFLEGWFKDTLPGPVEKLALLRIDCDLYESTMQVLEAMYPKMSKGGYVIVDDYGAVLGCKLAVDEYRAKNNITSQIVHVDWTGIWWEV